MSYNGLKTTLAAAAVIGVGALAFQAQADTYWRHHRRHVVLFTITVWRLFPWLRPPCRRPLVTG